MADVILSIVLLIVIGSAVLYIYKAKKRGKHCVGCPCSDQCKSSGCNCSKSEKEEQ